MSKAQVSAHLRKFGPGQRKILIDLQDHISAKLPTAEQAIKYGIPTFLIEGVAVIGFDGFKNHNSIFPYSGSFNARLKNELENYEQTKGSSAIIEQNSQGENYSDKCYLSEKEW